MLASSDNFQKCIHQGWHLKHLVTSLFLHKSLCVALCFSLLHWGLASLWHSELSLLVAQNHNIVTSWVTSLATVLCVFPSCQVLLTNVGNYYCIWTHHGLFIWLSGCMYLCCSVLPMGTHTPWAFTWKLSYEPYLITPVSPPWPQPCLGWSWRVIEVRGLQNEIFVSWKPWEHMSYVEMIHFSSRTVKLPSKTQKLCGELLPLDFAPSQLAKTFRLSIMEYAELPLQDFNLHFLSEWHQHLVQTHWTVFTHSFFFFWPLQILC